MALLAALALPACGGSDPDVAPSAIEVRDAAGRAVRLAAPARRVVSMIPSVTEWVIAIAGTDRLVARTDYDRQPALDTLPSVGGGLTPSIEWLAALEPDLVIAWPDAPSRSVVGRLETAGVPVYTAAAETIAQALAAATDLGRLLGVEAEADRAIAEVRAGLDSIRAAAAGRGTPDVLYLVGLDPLMAAGPGTFVAELLDIAGGRNVLADLHIRWPQIALEDVVARAPDVIIVGAAGGRGPALELRDRPGWRDVPAVQLGRVHAVDPDVVNRWGPRLHEAAARLAELIHADPGPSDAG